MRIAKSELLRFIDMICNQGDTSALQPLVLTLPPPLKSNERITSWPTAVMIRPLKYTKLNIYTTIHMDTNIYSLTYIHF